MTRPVLPPGVLDTLGMFEVTLAMPDQVEAALRALPLDVPPVAGLSAVSLLGMGGSGLAAQAAVAVAQRSCPVPLVVTKGYEPPAFTGPSTLTIAVSFSGDTEETVVAAGTALEAGSALVVVSRDGKLQQLALDAGATHVGVPGGIPMPRAGVAAMALPVLGVLEAVGLVDGVGPTARAAVEQLRRRRDELAAPGNGAEVLARRIGSTFPLVYGAGTLGGVAALRFKNQVNENAKAPAFSHEVPEVCHNEVCGWGQHGDVTRQVLSLVEMRHDHEHRRESKRFGLLRDLVAEVVSDVHTVRAAGEGPLAQLLDLFLFGDVVSLHMAAHLGVDPGPVPVLDDLKAALARSVATDD